MKLKKIGVLAIAMLSVAAFAFSINVQGAVIHNAVATPSSVKWDQHVNVSMVISSQTTGDWVGKVWCNLTAPSGTVYHLGNKSENVANNNVYHYNNWVYDPAESGIWTVTFEFQKASGSLTILTHTTTFTVERSGVWLGRAIGDWTGMIWLIFMVSALLLVIVAIYGRVGRDGGST